VSAITLSDMAIALSRARPAVPADERPLHELQDLIAGRKLLSVSDVANMLGVSSPTTIHNWVERGAFPCASVTVGGHRRFRLGDVIALKRQIDQTAAENASGRVEIPDFGDEDPYAGR
jgi:excisionase family DNA binding protein